jgi:hypothetical protein
VGWLTQVVVGMCRKLSALSKELKSNLGYVSKDSPMFIFIGHMIKSYTIMQWSLLLCLKINLSPLYS